MTERAWLGRVRDLAQLHRWRTYHTHDSRRSEPGFPDLVLVRGPRLVVAELKTAAGRVTPDQRAWLDALHGCGPPEVHLWRPDDWPTVLATLRHPPSLRVEDIR